MISVNDLKTGMTIEFDNGLWRVVDFQHVNPSKGATFVRSKLKNLRNGSVQERNFRAGEKVVTAHIEQREGQYLYESDGNHVFMETASYEQVELSTEQIEVELRFLLETSVCQMMMYGTETVGVSLPSNVALRVVETEAGISGEASAGTKSATMETGLIVQVPFFVNLDDILVIKTEDGSYVSRG